MPRGQYERRGHPRLRDDQGKLNGIGELVEQRRLDLRLTQADICARIQVETKDVWRPLRAEYARIVRGTRTVTELELHILARVLEVDACWLLTAPVLSSSQS